MGARLVGYMLANGTHLSNSAFRLAIYVGLHSRDIASRSEPANEYTLGARPAGEMLWPEMKPESARRTYTRAVNELIAAGLVHKVGTRGGRRAGRAQTLQIGPPAPVDRPPVDMWTTHRQRPK